MKFTLTRGYCAALILTLALSARRNPRDAQFRKTHNSSYRHRAFRSGQVTGDTARFLAERFGRTMQDRESFTTTRSDLNVTQSTQLEHSLPISRISSLSSGEFVGMVADTPHQPIDLKAFCYRFVNDPVALEKERAGFVELPLLRRTTPELLEENFHRIRKEVQGLVKAELGRISANPGLRHFLL